MELVLGALVVFCATAAARDFSWTLPAAVDLTQSQMLFGVACPSATQCTAIDGSGQEVTFDPSAPGTPTPVTVGAGESLNAVACPSATQCTAAATQWGTANQPTGYAVTFDPQTPGAPVTVLADGPAV